MSQVDLTLYRGQEARERVQQRTLGDLGLGNRHQLALAVGLRVENKADVPHALARDAAERGRRELRDGEVELRKGDFVRARGVLICGETRRQEHI